MDRRIRIITVHITEKAVAVGVLERARLAALHGDRAERARASEDRDHGEDGEALLAEKKPKEALAEAELALELGSPLGRARLVPGLRRRFASRGDALVVLDNHEDDRAVARVLDALRGLPVTWIVTARRCLLAGMTVHPVVPPGATEVLLVRHGQTPTTGKLLPGRAPGLHLAEVEPRQGGRTLFQCADGRHVSATFAAALGSS